MEIEVSFSFIIWEPAHLQLCFGFPLCSLTIFCLYICTAYFELYFAAWEVCFFVFQQHFATQQLYGFSVHMLTSYTHLITTSKTDSKYLFNSNIQRLLNHQTAGQPRIFQCLNILFAKIYSSVKLKFLWNKKKQVLILHDHKTNVWSDNFLHTIHSFLRLTNHKLRYKK